MKVKTAVNEWMPGQLEVVNICPDEGISPLLYAAQFGHVDCVKLLLQHGADASLATRLLCALPLHAALKNNHIE